MKKWGKKLKKVLINKKLPKLDKKIKKKLIICCFIKNKISLKSS